MMTQTQHKICLGLGSNLGDRLQALNDARVKVMDYITIEAISPVYETSSVYATDQPLFLNAALIGTTLLDPVPLLNSLKNTERAVGRMPTYHHGPRLIDLDLLFYDDVQFMNTELTVPHPRIAERSFVLFPLSHIAPDVKHPITGETVKEMLDKLETPESVILFAEQF